MKIAQIAPLIERVPPKGYGGTERVVHALTEELIKRGHDVTLFASGDSVTSAKLESIYPVSLREAKIAYPYPSILWTLCNIANAYKRMGEFDIIHDHSGIQSIPVALVSSTPVVMTLHGAFNKNTKPVFEKSLKRAKNIHFVSISDSQRKPIPHLNYAGTVYNGLPMEHYPFSSKSDGYLLFVGRISKEKGVHNAVAVARKLQIPLLIAAKLEEHNIDYFKRFIEPYLSDKIRLIGEVDERERNKLMSRALCFLHPITWREPFGLTLIEALSCGTPVVAMNKGSIPEIIRHGKTGFVVNNLEEMIDAVQTIDSIDREYCRKYALESFSAEKMTDGYEAIYEQVLVKKNELEAATYVRPGELPHEQPRRLTPHSIHEFLT